ncbi:MAG: YajQ family cyclic di-GMP-binding protein [Nitrospina sp.]|jgi:cyclic-di-GMP-binding protein|nr:YajQ family cyclic di-GMP-binding protein [Nitrospina sp.]MBT3414900.1 YajQ family cyclic di-GMP-binding protein [Nitrospina sp.]MBT3857303.1 YajQ family cyclic di-GMP-binding protein [Nitrospina sp.]MBT4103785.1 YajQ family cyclic di-GMP-binding protein [Nitrospina sp.]MBT4389075.1 YajQ family cyclic di-GMP-binding protein [Nitrospina sp.]
MASKSSSFDIASTTDLAEVQNACNQTMLEIRQRFDFKGSKSQVELDLKKAQVTINADDGNKLNAVIDILQGKLIKRKVSIKAMDYGKVESASGDAVRQVITVQQGIPQDKGKEIVKFIKGLGLKKVQAQIMDDQVRVTGKDKDDLQSIMASLKEKDFGVDMSFTNYR